MKNSLFSIKIKTFIVMASIAASVFTAGIVSAASIEASFRVTRGAGLRVFEKSMDETGRIPHFEAFKEFTLTKLTKSEGEVYDTYTGTIDAPTDFFHYVTGGGATGFVKQAKVLNVSVSRDISIEIDATPLVEGRREENGFRADDVYLNVNDAQYLLLEPNESFNLIPTRVWQAMEGDTENYFIEPDYEVEVIGGESVLSSTWGGAPGLEYARLAALSEGTAIVKITYGPILREMSQGGEPRYFNAIDPINTGIVVVSVVSDKYGADTSKIRTNIEAREYDTVYFDRAKTDHAEYSFKPTVDGDDPEISVRAHKPIHEGGATWGEAWSDGVEGGDGSFTVDLYEGRNIIEVSSSGLGFKEYHVITAKGIGITQSRKENGDVEINFDGIKTPLEKMAGLYNPGYGGTCYVLYKRSDGGVVSGDEGVQYNLAVKNTLTVTPPQSGSLTLSGGVINCPHLGDPLGSHRTKIGHEKIYRNFEAQRIDGFYSVMPDITVTGSGEEEEEEEGEEEGEEEEEEEEEEEGEGEGEEASSGGGCDTGVPAFGAIAAMLCLGVRYGRRALIK
ncbi:MAG: hypothetical protein LBQ58_01955 [Synergistaceae bacterium]|jgi:hypothetical protein|nr:hypothetical protein [Synergistaceae bacterium]